MRIISGNVTGPVVLVSRPIKYTFPLSYAYLAGYLKEQGEEVKILFRPTVDKAEDFAKEIIGMNPVLVGFGNLYPELKEISAFIKCLDNAGRKFPIVIGGQMVSPIPEFAVRITGADIGVIGEGEIILHNVVKALREGSNIKEVKGLAVREGNEVFLTGPGEVIPDLDKLPKIPYEFFPEKEWLNIGRWYTRYHQQPHWHFDDRVINAHSGRGCPYTCNFCYHHSKPRYRSMGVVMDEAREALERFNGNMLYFSDETALASPKRVREMIDGIRNLPRRIEFSVSCRFDILSRIDDAVLREMKDAGCRIMGLGIESGSDRILQIIGKRYPANIIREGLDRLKKAGILPTVSIMVGQYTETVEDVEMSIDLMRESVRNNHNIQYAFTVTTPFPGSALYEHIFKTGLLKDDREFYDIYFKSRKEFQYVVNLSKMSDAELMRMYQKILEEYNKEKEKVLNKKAVVVEKTMINVSKAYEIFMTRLFGGLAAKNAIADKFCRFCEFLFVAIEVWLDGIRLKIRGLR
ncbi:MAG TPA: radical SAM protein [Candidatus Omnitrophota bacterium]|nr:radical SAM protein [Candidatus Omnitrophota bacterium]HPS19413.1 radical SAM protein [Candidatus Omnitrophota bacterium]